jgi:hypothetical protein
VCPLVAVPRLVRGKDTKTAFVRCQLDVSTAGTAVIRLNGTRRITLWLDQTIVPAKEAIELQLTASVHMLRFAVDLGERRDGLGCELDDKPGTTAQVCFVGGK